MTTSTRTSVDTARQAAIALSDARKTYEEAFRALKRDVEQLPDDELWDNIDELALRFVPRHPAQDSKAVAHNWFYGLRMTRSFDLALWFVRFAKSYRFLANNKLAQGLDFVDRGSDSFGDLLDALPLAGRDVYEKACEGYFGSEKALEDAIKAAFEAKFAEAGFAGPFAAKNVKKAVGIVLNGENYVAMGLEDVARENFVWESRREPDDED